jgi:Protein of unknown function (DUF1761)
MTKSQALGIALGVVCAFVASSLWYSPLLFGKQFLELSGVVTAAKPTGITVAGEILRNLLLASVIVWLLAHRQPIKLKSVVVFGVILWFGFPVTLLSGSVIWQNVPLELALIHSGDWLVKILLMTVIPWFVSRNVEPRSGLLRQEQITDPTLHRN